MDHLDVAAALAAYDIGQLREDLQLEYDAPARTEIVLQFLDPRLVAPRPLTDAQVADLMAFLEALTDPRVDELPQRIPDEVPSGLPVDR